MTTHINTYLTFNGNCREAMTFYKECLGGSLTLQTIGESPLSEKMPPEMRSCILHATLTGKGVVLMGTDMVGEQGLIKGNAVSLMLHCASEKEMHGYYKRLSGGGKAIAPPQKTHWGALFGELTDKFGTHWLLHCDTATQ